MNEDRQKRVFTAASRRFDAPRVNGAILMNDLSNFLERFAKQKSPSKSEDDGFYWRKSDGYGTVFNRSLHTFYNNLKSYVTDNKIPLYRAYGAESLKISEIDFPKDRKEKNTHGLIISRKAVQDLIKEEMYHVREQDDQTEFKGWQKLQEFFDIAFKSLPDYSNVDLELVNAPIDMSKVKNNYVQLFDEWVREKELKAQRRVAAEAQAERERLAEKARQDLLKSKMKETSESFSCSDYNSRESFDKRIAEETAKLKKPSLINDGESVSRPYRTF